MLRHHPQIAPWPQCCLGLEPQSWGAPFRSSTALTSWLAGPGAARVCIALANAHCLWSAGHVREVQRAGGGNGVSRQLSALSGTMLNGLAYFTGVATTSFKREKCPRWPQAQADTRMFETRIPYFKQVIVMCTSCEKCGATCTDSAKMIALYLIYFLANRLSH